MESAGSWDSSAGAAPCARARSPDGGRFYGHRIDGFNRRGVPVREEPPRAWYNPRFPPEGGPGPPEDIIAFTPALLALAAEPAPLPPVAIALIVAFLVISLGVHEAAHGWVALQCGDTTARDMGRITLNPFAHVDLFMTIILPVLSLLTFGFPFGGAKPVPVNFHALRKPYRDMALVAIAGPLSNILLAMVFFLAQKIIVEELGLWQPVQMGLGVVKPIGYSVLEYSIYLNLILAAFNMLPIPPLDGSRVMTWILPSSLRPAYMRFEGFGLLIIFFLISMVPAVLHFVWTMVFWLARFVEAVVTLGGSW